MHGPPGDADAYKTSPATQSNVQIADIDEEMKVITYTQAGQDFRHLRAGSDRQRRPAGRDREGPARQGRLLICL